MTNPSAGPTGDEGNGTATRTSADDDSDATPPGRGGSKATDTKDAEKTWRIRIMTGSNADHVSPAKIHLQLIQEVQAQFGDKVRILTNGNVLMPRVDNLKWTAERHSKYFKIHPEVGHPRHARPQSKQNSDIRSSSRFIVHRVRSSVSLKEIKSTPKIYELLKNHKCYLNEHRWTEDVWDTVQLGFFQGMNPQFYSAEKVSSMISTEIKKAVPKTKIPKFQIAFCSPQTTIHNVQLRTKAYSIETGKSTSMEMLKILKQTYRETTEFIPFQMRSKHPEAYSRILSQQSKMIADQHVIIIQHISPDSMYYLSDRITSVDGVIDLIEAPNSEVLGRYRVLVHKDDFHHVRKTIQMNMSTWFTDCVPEDAKPNPDRYPGEPEVAPLISDGYSSGEESYYSSSVNTAMSYDSVSSDLTNDSSKNTNETTKSSRSWAQRVSGVQNSDQTVQNPSAPKSVQPTMIDESIISDLASSRAEVEDLKLEMKRMQDQHEAERQEQRNKAEHDKREAELHAKAHKLEMEKQAEEQRRLFNQQIDEQRREMEQTAVQQRRELESSMQEQIARALQAHLNRTPAPLPPDLHQMFANQSRQIQLLTRMMMTQLSYQDQSPSALASAGKRSADGMAVDDVSLDAATSRPPDGRKRVDLKGTPKKNAPVFDATPSSPLSTQSTHPRPPRGPSVSYHPWTPDSVSTVYPDNPNHPLHLGGDGPSDNEHESDTVMTGPRFSPFCSTQPGVLEEEAITPTQLEDIYLQHEECHRVNDSPKQPVDPRTEPGAVPRGPISGDKDPSSQATPVEEVNLDL